MKAKQTLKVTLIETDSLDQENNYYLYEIETTTAHYYYCTSDEELNEQQDNDYEVRDFSSKTELIERQDMSEDEWHIAQVLFSFLWDSSNGTNTCIDFDQLEEEHISKEQVEQFIEHFSLNDQLDVYEEDGVEIYWQFLCSFDLTTCDFFAHTHE